MTLRLYGDKDLSFDCCCFCCCCGCTLFGDVRLPFCRRGSGERALPVELLATRLGSPLTREDERERERDREGEDVFLRAWRPR